MSVLDLARPELRAVVHVHSVHATALASLRRPLPAFHYMVAIAGGDDVPCTPYHLFGSDALSQAVAGAMRERNACLMANHGLVAGGASLEHAVTIATIVRVTLVTMTGVRLGWLIREMRSGRYMEILLWYGIPLWGVPLSLTSRSQ